MLATSTVKLVLIPKNIQNKASIQIGVNVRVLTSLKDSELSEKYKTSIIFQIYITANREETIMRIATNH